MTPTYRNPGARRQPRSWGPLAFATATALLLAGCGDDKKSTAEEIKNFRPTSSTLFVADDQPDSCGVLTQDEVRVFVGNAVSKGTDTGAGQGCYYAAENQETAMLVNLQPGDSAAKFADSKSNAGEQSSNVQSVQSVGDEAFVYAPASGQIASAEARKGAMRVRIVVTGPNASIDVAKSALIAAVPRIPVK